jgi:hypothetical protein
MRQPLAPSACPPLVLVLLAAMLLLAVALALPPAAALAAVAPREATTCVTQTIACGQTINGSLDAGDCKGNNDLDSPGQGHTAQMAPGHQRRTLEGRKVFFNESRYKAPDAVVVCLLKIQFFYGIWMRDYGTARRYYNLQFFRVAEKNESCILGVSRD